MCFISKKYYGKDFMSLEFPPSYSNFPMYHNKNIRGFISMLLVSNSVCKLKSSHLI